MSAHHIFGADEARELAIVEARKWLGIPFALNSLSSTGVDCSRLLWHAYRTVGLHMPAPEDLPIVPRGFHLHSDDNRVLAIVEKYLHQVDAPGRADMAAFQIGRSFGHFGMVLAYRGLMDFDLLHAMEGHPTMEEAVNRRVVGRWRARAIRFYSPW